MFKYKNKIERDFWDDVFESVWGTYRDEETGLYRNVYINKIGELINSIKGDLDILLNIYGCYDANDVERLFAIYFYGAFHSLENTENLGDLALRFDEIYCNEWDKHEYWKYWKRPPIENRTKE